MPLLLAGLSTQRRAVVACLKRLTPRVSDQLGFWIGWTGLDMLDRIGYDAIQDMEGGMGLSRLARNDFVRFMQLAAFFTSYTRAKHVSAFAVC